MLPVLPPLQITSVFANGSNVTADGIIGVTLTVRSQFVMASLTFIWYNVPAISPVNPVAVGIAVGTIDKT